MRGATLSALSCIHLALISIHAPTRGATTLTVTVAMLSLNFNPRSHEGSDGRMRADAQPSIGFQSTLPRGERHICCRKERFRPYFNPRSHEGSDLVYTGCSPILANFNPRSHEGSDHLRRKCSLPPDHFNPRSHEGSDEFGDTERYNPFAFQSTLPRGERRRSPDKKEPRCGFQSTLPRGERPFSADWRCAARHHFNPRSHEGATDHGGVDIYVSKISIHAPTRGATVLPYTIT